MSSPDPSGGLHGQLALVTGAGRGIGRAIALALAEQGMNVALLGRRHETLAETLHACAEHGVRGVALSVDVSSWGAVSKAVGSVERDLGPVDFLVNNAGQVDQAEVPLWEADPVQWWQVVETNLHGPFNLLRAVLPSMVARARGRVLNLNSGFAVRPDANYTAYATSKAALLRLSDNLAGALDPHRVTVLDISPGAVRTDMTAGMPMFAGMTDWGSIPYTAQVAVAAASGRLDPLHGRFLHLGRDDLEELLRRADEVRHRDARQLRLRPYAPDDPLQ